MTNPAKTSRVALESGALIVTDSQSVDRELGVIAKRDFSKGEVLFTVKGPVLSQPSRYSFAIGIDLHIEPERKDGQPDFGHYINHSCDPSAYVRVVCNKGEAQYVEVVARRTIKKGQELTFDYASLEYDVTVSGMKCKCRSGVCRGVIHGFKDLPKAIFNQYKKEGLIPDHLLSIKLPSNAK